MDPSSWREVGLGAVLHLRERVGQTLGHSRRQVVPSRSPARSTDHLEDSRFAPGTTRFSRMTDTTWMDATAQAELVRSGQASPA